MCSGKCFARRMQSFVPWIFARLERTFHKDARLMAISRHSLLTQVARPRMRMSMSLAWAKMRARISVGRLAIGYRKPLVYAFDLSGRRHTAFLDLKMSAKSSSTVRLLRNDVSIVLASKRSSSTCFIVSCTTSNCCSVECGNPLSGANLYAFLPL